MSAGIAEAVALTRDEFHVVAEFIRQRAGIIVCNRDRVGRKLKPVALRFGFRSSAQLVGELRQPSSSFAREIVDALTTNETFFFRDMPVFDALRRETLPALIAARRAEKRLRIWCAAASTGQEVYSLALLLDEFRAQLDDWKIEILGTDISEVAIARATQGLYTEAEAERGLPQAILHKHFVRVIDGWHAKPALREAVTFTTRNLIEPFAFLGTFDLILCRTALIYFDPPTKQDVLTRLAKQLAPDGYLVLGLAETIQGFSTSFERANPVRGIYHQGNAVRERKLAS